MKIKEYKQKYEIEKIKTRYKFPVSDFSVYDFSKENVLDRTTAQKILIFLFNNGVLSRKRVSRTYIYMLIKT